MAVLGMVGAGLLLVGCGIRVLRDFTGTKVQDIIYDDRCDLQEYFDTMASRKVARPVVLRSTDIGKFDRDRASGGKTTFGIQTDFQRAHFRRLLTQNWRNLPAEVLTANALEVQVRWAEKAGTRRVVTTESAVIAANGREFELPYHICLSEFLFGESLYAVRREMLGLPPLDAGPVLVTTPVADGGPAPAPDAALDPGSDARANDPRE